MTQKQIKIKTSGTNLVIRSSEGEIYEKYIESPKVMLRKDAEENHVPEGDYLISVEKKTDEIIIPEEIIEALKAGKTITIDNETRESEEE